MIQSCIMGKYSGTISKARCMSVKYIRSTPRRRVEYSGLGNGLSAKIEDPSTRKESFQDDQVACRYVPVHTCANSFVSQYCTSISLQKHELLVVVHR